ncbi:acetate--CoA ligase family protein [Thermodesulforhabdus norvegica]|uniref:Acyl-CoA synthetase (NDP forming) n=1 Tax=Thermodesulforhabdus norvegica TaxID=39841 RepID=A0A1I4UM54_9BACT|nr:acetate--CoA ligase family protein [Thermodesulforhabdus norvegica]SFM89793.1 Acyl-CoA synthetase (NDP forming) [Thermodesulforhabdus norvegica]
MERVDLRRFFAPRSIAVIGASQDFTRITGKPLYYLRKHGYTGRLYPVNPRYSSIDGLPCYSTIAEVPDEIDLALIAVNFRMVPQVLRECSDKGVRFATIFSSGFAETGEEGKRIQKEIAEIAREGGIRVCGPNCQGAVDLHNNTAAAFSAALDVYPLIKGSVGFATQSGAMGFSIFNLAQSQGIGFSYIVSTGNEMDLTCVDFMQFMLDDPNTSVICAYLEGIRDGKAFVELAERAQDVGKPIVVLKTGKSDVGSRAASSHTAALTGSDDVFDALCRQKGIIRVSDIDELIDVTRIITSFATPPSGRGLGIISTSGGGGVLCADIADELGLKVPEFEKEGLEKIKSSIPAFGSARNPVDMTAQVINTAEGFRNVLQAVVDDPGVDALVVVITMIVGTSATKMALDLARIKKTTHKPIAVVWTAGESLIREQLEILKEASVPYYSCPSRALRSLARYLQFGNYLKNRSRTPSVIELRRHIGFSSEKYRSGVLSEHGSKEVLSRFEIPVTREICTDSVERAVDFAREIGYPVALKIDSPDILHKTEAGLIRLNIRSEEELVRSFRDLLGIAKSKYPQARINGVLVQEMVSPGVEVMVGVKRDPQFGPTVVFGLGGIFVEVLKDVTMRVAPVDEAEALKMIREIRGYPILEGVRGSAKSDVKALAGIISRVSYMALALPNLSELDINPVIVFPEGSGAKAVDALMIFD